MKLKFGLCLLWSIISLTYSASSHNKWDLLGEIQSDGNLGHYTHSCVGDLRLCTEGFTISIDFETLPAREQVETGHEFILTTGGESSLANGFYIKHVFDRQYEVAVSNGTKTWMTKFDLPSDSRVTVTSSWLEELKVYVDGFLIDQKAEVVERVWVPQPYNAAPYLITGKHTSVRMFAIQHWDEVLIDQDIFEEVELQGQCVGFETVFELYGDQPRDAYWCRSMCHKAGYAITGYRNMQCACSDHILEETTECSNTTWIVMRTSAILQMLPTLELNVELDLGQPMFDPEYFLPDESVQITVRTNYDDFIYDIDFGDETESTGLLFKTVNHIYNREGDFTVEVVARRGDQQITTFTSVAVKDIGLGSPPKVAVDLLSDKMFTQLALTMDAVVYGDFPANCSLSPGDYLFEVNTAFHRLNADFVYEEPGTDFAALSCMNRFGSSSTVKLPVRSSFTEIVEMDWQESDQFHISLDLETSNGINAEVDNIGVVFEYDQLTKTLSFDSDVFRFPGVHIISVFRGSVRIFSASVLYEEPLTELDLILDSQYLAIGEIGQLNVSLKTGDPVHLYIDFKNGSEVYFLHNEESGFVATFDILFSKAEEYLIEVRAANSRGEISSSITLIVEHILKPVTATVENILSLEQAALFQLQSTNEVDIQTECEFQYSDESFMVGVTLLAQGQTSPVYYLFTKYGVHDVKIIVSNHVSYVETHVTIKVGEEIEELDVATDTETVALMEDFILDIYCPRGSAVTFKVDFGDGTVATVLADGTVMDVRSLTQAQPNITVTTTKSPIEGMTMEATTNHPDRGRRAVLDFSNHVLQYTTSGGLEAGISVSDGNLPATTPATPTKPVTTHSADYDMTTEAYTGPEPLYHTTYQIVYRFGVAGQFPIHIDASNHYNNKSVNMCPVLVYERSYSTCHLGLASAINSSYSDPIVRYRSDDIYFEQLAVSSCGDILYWIKIDGYTIDDEVGRRVTPLKDICPIYNVGLLAAIVPRSLIYGRYVVTMTTMDASDPHISLRTQFYLKVIPTPLVANIRKGPDRQILTNDIMPLDISLSRDPDFDPEEEDTDLVKEVFCFPYEINKTPQYLDREEDLVRRNNTFFFDVGCFSNPDMFVALKDSLFRFDAGVLSLNSSYSFVLRVAKDRRSSFFIQRVQPIASNFTSLDEVGSQLDALLASGDNDAVLFVAGRASEELNNVDASEDSAAAKEKRAALRSKIIDAMSSVAGNINNFEQLSATSSTLKSVTQSSGEVTPDSKNSAAGALSSVSEATTGFAAQPTNRLSKAAGSMVNAVSNLMPTNGEEQPIPGAKMSSRSKKNKPSKPEVLEAEFNGPDGEEPAVSEEDFDEWDGDRTVDQELYEFFTDEELEEMINFWHPDDRAEELAVRRAERDASIQAMKDNDKSIATKSLGAANGVSDVLLGKDDAGADEPLTLESPKLAVKLAKAPANATGPQVLDSAVGGFAMPAGEAGEGNSTRNTKFMAATDNPYNWDDSAATIAGAMTIEFSSDDGEPIEVKNMTEPLGLDVKGMETAPNYTAFTVYTSIEDDYIQYHATPIAILDSSVHITIYPHLPDDVYQVYWAYNFYPNITHYDFTAYIPNEETYATNDTELLDILHHTFSPPQHMTATNGSYYLGMKLVGEKVVLPIESTNHTYDYSTFITGCKYWNKSEERWASDGCTVGNLTSWKSTQCLCTHLTSFGGDIVVPPNTINFATVFSKFKDLGENAAVFSTIVSVFGLWLLSLIWARHQDKKDLLKWGALPLEDNLPTDKYNYQIAVHTGVRKNASTTSNVCFILSGDDGDTGPRRLSDGKRYGFHRSTIKNFILSVDKSLGGLSFLRIWHDNTGKGKYKSWYLNQIQVSNLQTGEKNYFVVDKWFAVEEDDGMVDRLVPVAGLDDLTNFSHLFTHSLTKKLTNDHLWVSVISRPTRSSFTRCQRISCCVCMLFMTMITNCMFFKAEENAERVDVVKIGPVEFTLQSVFVSVISTAIVFPISFIVVTIFRKTRPKPNKLQQSNQPPTSTKYGWKSLSGSTLWGKQKQTKRQRMKQNLTKLLTSRKDTAYTDKPRKGVKPKSFTFPHWVLPIGWILCVLSILAAGFFTILYSMEWGPQKSNDWLTTFLLSFFQSVIVVQPIKVFMLVAFISCILRKPDLDEEQEDDDDYCNNAIPAADEEIITVEQTMQVEELLAKRRELAASMKPPDFEALRKARKKRQNEIEMEAILKEIVVYFIFVCILVYLSYQNRSTQGHPLWLTSKDVFFDNSPNLASVSTIPAYWNWVNRVLIPGMYLQSRYNGDTRLTWREALGTADPNLVRVGVGRLRQQRLKPNDTCTIRKEMAPLINHCRGHYNWIDDDTESYHPYWFPASDLDQEEDKFTEDTFYAWKYRDSIELANTPYPAQLALYKGGGYTAKFGRTLRSTEKMIGKLKEEDWIDVFTRVVFAEFTLFNANSNLFVSAIITSEFMATGGMIHKFEFKVLRLFSYVGSWGVINLIMEIIFLVFTIYFLYFEIKRIRVLGFKKYINNFWNMVEFSTLFLCVFCIVCYVMKQGLVQLSMSSLEESGSTDFVNFQSLALYDEMLGYVMAFVVFACTVKSIKLLKFNRKMAMLGDTIRLCSKDLKPFSVSFGIYFMAFAMFGFMLFNKELESYGTFTGTLESLFAFSLGDYDYESFVGANPLGQFFFMAFVFVVFFGLMSMFVTIICEAFAVIKEDAQEATNDYEIMDFVVTKVKKMFGIEEKEEVSEEELAADEGGGEDGK